MHATNETEADTRANRIDPVLRDAGWRVVDGAHVCYGAVNDAKLALGSAEVIRRAFVDIQGLLFH